MARKPSGIFLCEGDLEPTGTFRDPGAKTRPEFRLRVPVVYEVGGQGSGLIVTVPAGYITDRYSLPGRVLQGWQPEGVKWWAPALVHDWLYDTGLVPRSVADAILLEAMRAIGVEQWQRTVVYNAVAAGGRSGFGKPEPANLRLVRDARARPLEARLADYYGSPIGGGSK